MTMEHNAKVPKRPTSGERPQGANEQNSEDISAGMSGEGEVDRSDKHTRYEDDRGVEERETGRGSGTDPLDPEATQEGGEVSRRGVPGFHTTHEPGTGRAMARLEMDADEEDLGRVNTGTGDQPGNTGGDRFATPHQDRP